MSCIKTDLTGGKIENATRIAAWLDGNFGDIIVEWWKLSGSFLRTAYNRRTTETRYYFEPTDTEAFSRLLRENAK